MIKLSIIITTYNLESYIKRTLYSVAEAIDDYCEIIVVDDGSNDNTVLITEKFLRIKQIKNFQIHCQSNKGVSAARNRGIDLSRGKYLFFLDGDDLISPNFLQLFNEIFALENPKDIIVFPYNVVNQEQKILIDFNKKYSRLRHPIDGVQLLSKILSRRYNVCTSSLLYNSNFIKSNAIYYDVTCSYGEDTEFIFKSLLLSKSIDFIDDVLFQYVRRAHSLMGTFSLSKFESINALYRVILFIKLNWVDRYDIIVSQIYTRILNEYYDNYILNKEILNNSLLDEKNIKFSRKTVKNCYPKTWEIILHALDKIQSKRNRLKYNVMIKYPDIYYFVRKVVRK